MVPAGVNHIVDCAGVTPLTGEAIKALAIGGMLGLVAVPPSPDRKFEVPWLDTLLQGQIIHTEGNSIPDIFIPEMIDICAGTLPIRQAYLVPSIGEINNAVADQPAGKAIKAVLELGA
jgi:aryl-alcohol dehydrogenase